MTNQEGPKIIPPSEPEDDGMSSGSQAPPPSAAGPERSVKKPERQLKKLRRALYRRTQSEVLTERHDDLKWLGLRRKSLRRTHAGAGRDSVNYHEKQSRRRLIKSFVKYGALLFILLVIFGVSAAATLWYRQQRVVLDEQVHVEVQAPTEIAAGEVLRYAITYANASTVDWRDVELSVKVPEGLVVQEVPSEALVSGRDVVLTVGELASDEQGSFLITGQMWAQEGAVVATEATMAFTPANIPNESFQQTKQALATTTITAAPVDVSVDVVREATSGERIRAEVSVTNRRSEPLTNAYLTVPLTPGVTLLSSDPEFTAGFDQRDSTWELETIPSLGTIKRTIIFSVSGRQGEQRPLDIEVGIANGGTRYVQRKTSTPLTIASTELTISQTYNEQTSPLSARGGQRLTGVVTYENTGTLPLNGAIARVAFEGAAFNPGAVKLSNGSFDPNTNTITWTAASVPELAVLDPGETGTIAYTIGLNGALDLPAGEESKNSIIQALASIDSPDALEASGQPQAPATHRFLFSVTTDLTLSVDAVYDDGRLGLESTGPHPAQVGEETTYTLRIRLGSSLNDVGEVEVSGALAEGIRYTGKSFTTTGELTVDERTGQFAWTVPLIAGLTGRTQPQEEAHLQVALIPSSQQQFSFIPFMRELVASGLDLFTDVDLSASVNTLPTTKSVKTLSE